MEKSTDLWVAGLFKGSACGRWRGLPLSCAKEARSPKLRLLGGSWDVVSLLLISKKCLSKMISLHKYSYPVLVVTLVLKSPPDFSVSGLQLIAVIGLWACGHTGF